MIRLNAAHEILVRRWRAVERVADRLERRGRLTREEIEAAALLANAGGER